jgi:deoxyribodipyrimidine photolyase-like uncharacterized protein
LARNAERLDGNMRIAMPLRSLKKRPDEQRATDAEVGAWVREELAAGRELAPEGD